MRHKAGLLYHWAVRICLLLAVAVLSVNCVGSSGMKSPGPFPRDPDSGVIIGAEEVRIDRGRAGACLLLHGWLASPADFRDLSERLDAAGWDVWAPRHTAHGTHPADLVGITAEDLLENARDRYNDLRETHERVVLIGFSMGGTIATILASESRPDGLVLVAPFYGVTHKWYYILPADWWRRLLSPLFVSMPHSRKRLHVNRKEVREKIITYHAFPTDITTALFDLRRIVVQECDLSGLDMPLLVVYAPKDGVASTRATRRFVDRMPTQDVQWVSCPESDHYILYDFDGEAALGAIVHFVESLAPEPAQSSSDSVSRSAR